MRTHILDDIHYLNHTTKTQIKNQTASILKALEMPEDTEVCITLIDDQAMRELNNKYRGINKTTDVLSFSQVENNSPELNAAIAPATNSPYHIGDLVISLPTAQRQAQRNDTPLTQLLTKLIIHGILHLIGHDHKKRREKHLMREKEEELLQLIYPD